MEITAHELSAIRWQCRRGMLELDLLLNDFVDHRVPGLSGQQLSNLKMLLTYQDQALYDLLLGKTVNEDPQLMEIVQLIRSVQVT